MSGEKKENKGGKGEIELKLGAFIKRSFEQCWTADPSKPDAVPQISRSKAKKYIKGLMEQYGHETAWDEEEFDRMFDLFEEDEGGEPGNVDDEGGLDESEFTKLVCRMA